jgi:hypothetical protein
VAEALKAEIVASHCARSDFFRGPPNVPTFVAIIKLLTPS